MENVNSLQIGLVLRRSQVAVESYLLNGTRRDGLCYSVGGVAKGIQHETDLCFLVKSRHHQQVPSSRKFTVRCFLHCQEPASFITPAFHTAVTAFA